MVELENVWERQNRLGRTKITFGESQLVQKVDCFHAKPYHNVRSVHRLEGAKS